MNRYTIRGATTVNYNNEENIEEETINLLNKIFDENSLKNEDIESIIFTCTKDLDAVYPAKFARKIGLNDATLLCMQEMNVKDSLEKCIRVLIFLRNNVKLKNVSHIYLNNAETLRKDL
jgi:monofunctional chorismate mutase